MPARLTQGKQHKEIQNFDYNLKYLENAELSRCYEHFKERLKERNGHDLGYREYWDNWICFLRGDFIQYDDKGRMLRLLGSYHSDTVLWKVVYVKVKDLNIYAPLTIIDIPSHKKKLNIYKLALQNKKKDNLQIKPIDS